MVLLGSIFRFHDLSVLLVASFINFCVTNQVLQESFKIVAGDLMSGFSHDFVDIIFYEYLDIFEIISYCMSDPFTLIDL